MIWRADVSRCFGSRFQSCYSVCSRKIEPSVSIAQVLALRDDGALTSPNRAVIAIFQRHEPENTHTNSERRMQQLSAKGEGLSEEDRFLDLEAAFPIWDRPAVTVAAT